MMGEPQATILDWDELAVCSWLRSIGFDQYDAQIQEHSITGEVLAILDHESLKEVGVGSIGQRLAILKAVYHVKLAHNVPIEPDAYVPPSEANDGLEIISLERLNEIVREQDSRLRLLEDDNRRLLERFSSHDDHSNKKHSPPQPPPDHTLTRQPSFKWANFVKPAKSPTKQNSLDAGISDSPRSSPQAMEHDVPQQNVTPPTPARPSKPQPAPVNTAPTSAESAAATSDNLKSFKVSLDDPAWKVLPAALKKYKINNDDWQNYAMFICYGNTERCLSYDEKPLLLFQKLKEAKKNPVFMLKHIKDIRSPIAVAKQKQAQRQKTQTSSADAGPRPTPHPPVIKTSAPQLGTAPWPDIMSPGGVDPSAVVSKANAEVPTEEASGSAPAAGTGKSRTHTGNSNSDEDWVITPSGISYAVSIYPYMAEQDDELDVVVGDYYIILHRARGWWNVQCDPQGSGIVDQENGRAGWVPAGCLLETKVPVATAVAEAAGSASPSAVAGKNPILPLSIISTSFPGVALMDYHKKGDEELELHKDDALRVFKRYNHWSYAVKEQGGDRGWVPSWFIGKASSSSHSAGIPPTPITGPTINTSAASTAAATLLDTELRYAASSVESPLSPGFPHVAQAPRTAGFI
ncbi:RA-domain-containing protein [Exidia glandulosa HHB12029]|uniref:RA-domain-containing protein n=1 Tax=Exidia glandulosa HHB12029 TaxID=1314781 RepID=A0A165HRU9_EXIGL|nr:RA-domain-containing protein [Exidia glandulosa HHB12029]